MRAFMRWYGANPLHLLALLASFAFVGYVAVPMLASSPWSIIIWFVGSAVLHDFLLFPLYTLADLPVASAWRHRFERGQPTVTVPWINYVRFPVVISGTLGLMWLPLIARLPPSYTAFTGYSMTPYLPRWLVVTGILFAVSGLLYAWRLGRARRYAKQHDAPGGTAE